MEKTELNALKKKVLGEIKRDTNGAVVEVMNNMNQKEIFFSYGVTVAKIKEVSREYTPNHELAQELFNSKIRELKLAAIYIDSPSEVTEEQMELWRESFDSLEIAEHCSTMLFYAADCALKQARKWVEYEDNFTPMSAYLIALKRVRIMFKEGELESYMILFSKAIEDICSRSNPHVIRIAEDFVAAFANKNSEVKKILANLINNRVLGCSGVEIEWQIL